MDCRSWEEKVRYDSSLFWYNDNQFLDLHYCTLSVLLFGWGRNRNLRICHTQNKIFSDLAKLCLNFSLFVISKNANISPVSVLPMTCADLQFLQDKFSK